MSPGTSSRKRIFTPSDDAMIREQRVTGNGLKTLETMLRTSRDTLLRRAGELGVFRCSSAMIMIMTERSTRGGSVAAMSSSIRYWNG
jgi:hypothetical protein